ncbi:hypothetical protein SDRG_14571 [Saprolegnia diclina VS20]|uniref:Fibronectin type-III domain-containing protein n=1 Tax=Saprolegnia diclina (strain VS20) TaxID=1156394 RepID=T0R6F9_SAPDV|nr:hypothetical protein SDRG_14571 [Saprolegnia diclina VS20]EQC27663.1 hypothetical protein SDRG_14571 [Saprolegnia diclina VS20]|eukprot:XP_008618931.1 hypothetical protein SDRG_14571 [Saprolegnia diclina VS20]
MEVSNVRMGLRRKASRGGKRFSLAGAPSKKGASTRRTILTPAMRLEEETMAATMLQRMVRARLARNAFRRVLCDVYRKVYDQTNKQVRYVDARTGLSTTTKPLLLRLLQCDGQEIIEPVLPHDAALRIQRQFKTWRTRLLLKDMIRDLYQKHMDPETKNYYYINTQTHEVFPTKPVFLGDDDIEIERFKYRNATCRLSTRSNLIGNGVAVLYNSVVCVLTDCFTLPDEDTARYSRVQFNYKPGGIPFMVRLRSDVFFMTSQFESIHQAAMPELDFTLCALDQDEFRSTSGESVEAIRLVFTDRRLCCAQDVLRHEELEIVGHPHGKQTCSNRNHVDQFLPNMVNPKRLRYRGPMESGASGSAVFNFGGRLVGIHHQHSLKVAPHECTLVKPIVAFTQQPPVPLLLTSCLGHDSVNLYWHLPPTYKPLNGLPIQFTLEVCSRKEKRSRGYYDRFSAVYTGTKLTFTMYGLAPATLYAARCRSFHIMEKGAWCPPMQFITLEAPTNAWQVSQCTSIRAALRFLRDSTDVLVHRKAIQWLCNACDHTFDDKDDDTESSNNNAATLWHDVESDWIDGCAFDVLQSSVDRFRHAMDHVLDCLLVLGHVCSFRTAFRDRLVDIPHLQWLLDLFLEFRSEARLMEAGLAFLGYCIKDFETGKQVFMAIHAMPRVLDLIETHPADDGVAREASYVLAALCQNFPPGQQLMGMHQGIRVLAKVLAAFPYHPKVLYWACLALGNVACDFPANQARGQKYHIVDCLVQSKIKFIMKRDALSDAMAKEVEILDGLHATAMGEEARNVIERHETRLEGLRAMYNYMESENVIGVANFALDYMMNDEQKAIQERTRHLARKMGAVYLQSALQHWKQQTDKVRDGAVLRAFLARLQERELFAAMRQWECANRQLRVEQQTFAATLKQTGLALNLGKKKAERYRLMVLSK